MVIPFVVWCHFINYFVIRHFKASDTLKFLSKACVKRHYHYKQHRFGLDKFRDWCYFLARLETLNGT